MTDELDRFARDARRTVDSGYYGRIPEGAPGRAGPSLKAALARPGKLPVVAEIKPKSPTAGALRVDADAGGLARAFLDAGARGVSILTEPRRFGGSLANLVAASTVGPVGDVPASGTHPGPGSGARAAPAPRASTASAPGTAAGQAPGTGAAVLFKDFVVSDAQLDAARACGASAVLLILPIIERGAADWDLAGSIRAAHTRGLEVLMEVYTRDEYDRAADAGSDIIGINNRDLRNLTMDPGRAARVLAEAGKRAPTMALSGADTRADIARELAAGADGVLVGSALMRALDPAKQLEEMIT